MVKKKEKQTTNNKKSFYAELTLLIDDVSLILEGWGEY